MLLGGLVASLSLSGCFPRQAHYDDDPSRRSPEFVKPFGFEGPLADVGRARIASFIGVANPMLSADLVRRESDAIAVAASKEGIPASLLASLIATESSFDPRAVSPVGAQGLGQLMPATATDLGVSDPFDPESNIAGTAKYLAWLGRYWAKNPRHWELALASYLAGVGTVGNQLKTGRDLTQEEAAYARRILQLSTKV